MNVETRTEQMDRIRREGLRVGELEDELIRAEQRGAALGVVPCLSHDGCLSARVFEYLRTQTGTVTQVANALDAGVQQTDRAVRRLRSLGRIDVVRRVDSPKKFGILVAEYGISRP